MFAVLLPVQRQIATTMKCATANSRPMERMVGALGIKTGQWRSADPRISMARMPAPGINTEDQSGLRCRQVRSCTYPLRQVPPRYSEANSLRQSGSGREACRVKAFWLLFLSVLLPDGLRARSFAGPATVC